MNYLQEEMENTFPNMNLKKQKKDLTKYDSPVYEDREIASSRSMSIAAAVKNFF
jgi:hypothetical protein